METNHGRVEALTACVLMILLAAGAQGCSESHNAGTRDAAADIADSAIDRPDAPQEDASDERAGRVVCGDSVCSLASEGCLATCLEEGLAVPACVPLRDERFPTECPSGAESFPIAWLLCDGREDCPAGEWCHLVRGSLGSYAFCDACDGGCDAASFDVLCRILADCPPGTTACTPNPELAGYPTCRPR